MPSPLPILDAGFWLASVSRISVFPVGLFDANELIGLWWENLIGRSPDEIQHFPREARSVQRGVAEINGLTCGVLLEVQPRRADVRLSSASEAIDPTADQSETIGTLHHVLAATRLLADRFLPRCPDLNRMALGVVSRHEEETMDAVYGHLSRFTGIPLSFGSASDFVLQINRPRDLADVETGLRVNRLTKWSGITLRRVQLGIGAKPTIEHQAEISRFMQMELDINSDGARAEPLPPAKLTELFAEFCRMVEEIAESGLGIDDAG